MPSTKSKQPWPQQWALAQELRTMLAPACDRVEIAGSLRRCKPLVGDIELVAVPAFYEAEPDGLPGLSLKVSREYSALDDTLDDLVDRNVIEPLSGFKLRGRQRRSAKFVFEGVGVDLFLQPDPATWGVNFMIRTGSAEFTAWMMTKRYKNGGKPNNLENREARLWHVGAGGSAVLATPQEDDVFAVYGLPYIHPIARIHDFYGVAPENMLERALELLKHAVTSEVPRVEDLELMLGRNFNSYAEAVTYCLDAGLTATVEVSSRVA